MKVFISHSSKDDAFVTRLAADLRGAGVQTWVDHKDILVGDDWDESIGLALDACDAMILVISPRSMDSKNVKAEWNHFFETKKPFYPIIHEVCRVPYRLDIYQKVNFTENYVTGINDLLQALRMGNRGAEHLSFQPPHVVLIPAGPFLMGSTREHLVGLYQHYKPTDIFDNELEQYWVDLLGYYIGKFPVTIEEYGMFIKNDGYYQKSYWTESGWEYKERENWRQPSIWDDKKYSGHNRFPVTGVSWYEAYAYCRWLSETTGQAYRLPTEEEWEKAARGTDGRVYPWGNEWQNDICNTLEIWGGDRKRGHITVVDKYGSLSDSPYGALDMSGNVFEWCQTKWRQSYKKRVDNNPEGFGERVVRGGAWNWPRYGARTAYRYWFSVSERSTNLGFRVAMSV